MLTCVLLQVLLTTEGRANGRTLLRENEVIQKVLKSLKFLVVTVMITVYRRGVQVIKLL
jgi:hypothetical protein